ncbi:hypothetical protein BCR33DRAFT_849962 [Rhizoclosmatium globosum]|uniref:Uncharacterized protein n=1 Tax=Rhizoclosmatium globosum TaxID=329046 RepID=A0A1Y2CDA4_9FUNG|nr:hypothetical protein BCR33DRAFT_849962 [Rhizoclosmatium globosum]|eukprot:ORY45040.1 hypothetical protein BCR33DRAFT_849962 [Rhizoclosmatium globosum]
MATGFDKWLLNASGETVGLEVLEGGKRLRFIIRHCPGYYSKACIPFQERETWKQNYMKKLESYGAQIFERIGHLPVHLNMITKTDPQGNLKKYCCQQHRQTHYKKIEPDVVVFEQGNAVDQAVQPAQPTELHAHQHQATQPQNQTQPHPPAQPQNQTQPHPPAQPQNQTQPQAQPPTAQPEVVEFVEPMQLENQSHQQILPSNHPEYLKLQEENLRLKKELKQTKKELSEARSMLQLIEQQQAFPQRSQSSSSSFMSTQQQSSVASNQESSSNTQKIPLKDFDDSESLMLDFNSDGFPDNSSSCSGSSLGTLEPITHSSRSQQKILDRDSDSDSDSDSEAESVIFARPQRFAKNPISSQRGELNTTPASTSRLLTTPTYQKSSTSLVPANSTTLLSLHSGKFVATPKAEREKIEQAHLKKFDALKKQQLDKDKPETAASSPKKGEMAKDFM